MSGSVYILPDLGWAMLLDPIIRDAPEGAAIEVWTLAMFELVIERLGESGRIDIAVRLVWVPPARMSMMGIP